MPIYIDASRAVVTMQRLGKQLSPSMVNTALARTINRVASQGKTQASKDIRKLYRIKKVDLDKKLEAHKATKSKLVGRIEAHGVPISLNYFRPIQRRYGVTVNITGRRRLVKHAFITDVPVRKKGKLTGEKNRIVAMRAGKGYKSDSGIAYKPGGRLPITKLVTLSEGAMFGNQDVIEKTEAKIESTFASRFDHELDYLLSRV